MLVHLCTDYPGGACRPRHRECFLQHGQSLGGQFREIIGQDRHSARHCDHGCPDARFIQRQGRADDQAVRIVQPDRAMIEAAQRCRAGRCLNAGPAGVDIFSNPHAVDQAGSMLKRCAAAEEEPLGAQSAAQCRQPAAVRLGLREAAIVKRLPPRCGPLQKIDFEVVVAPLSHDAAREIIQPLLDIGMRAVERENPPAPR